MFVIQDFPRCVEIALATRDLHMNFQEYFEQIPIIDSPKLASLYLGTGCFG